MSSHADTQSKPSKPTDTIKMSTTEQRQQQQQLFFAETDGLLPKATASVLPKLGVVRRWVPVIGTLSIVTVSILAVFFGGEGAIIHKAYHHSSFPQAQRIKLQLSTENELTSIIPHDTLAKINRDTKHFADSEREDHVSSSSLVNIHAVDHGPNRHHREDDDSDDRKTRRSLHCTSQLMILRHCDKEVKFNLHGKHFTTDAADSSGNRHCSATGKARSMYIASLFIDPKEYNKLVTSPRHHHHHHHRDDDEESRSNGGNDDIVIPPPVPYIKSSLKKVSKVASKTKPQFPAPIKLYALNEARDRAMGSKHVHENFREIETITPLADKFHLRVESKYGVGDEERLASDYFTSLSRSVRDKYRRKMNRDDDDDRRRLNLNDDEEEKDLCNGGMTVVNWKHSRMPHLAHALGCGTHEGCPKKYNGKDFDTMWLITYEYTLGLDDDDGHHHHHDAPSGRETESKSLVALEKRSIPEDDEHHHHRHLHRHHDVGKWKINADLINEGFYPV